MHHSCTRAPKWSHGNQKSLLTTFKHVWHMIRNVAPVEAPCIFLENLEKNTKIISKKTENVTYRSDQKKMRFCPRFLVEKTSKNRAPVSTRWAFLKIILKMHDIFYVSFGLIVWWFFRFFQDKLAWEMKQMVCILQVKLHIVMFCIQNWHTHTKNVKKHGKIMKKEAYKPQKWCSRLGETLGCEKASFLNK